MTSLQIILAVIAAQLVGLTVGFLVARWEGPRYRIRTWGKSGWGYSYTPEAYAAKCAAEKSGGIVKPEWRI